MIIGNNIKKYRIIRGLTQEELAKLIGCTTPLIGGREPVRPVISLKSCVKHSSGDGTSSNPYEVTIDDTCASAEN